MTESSTVNSSADTRNLATLPGGFSELHSPLLDCLVIYSRLNRQPTSKDAVISGLPIKEGKITPEIFKRAASRAGLISNFKNRSLSDIPNLILPCKTTRPAYLNISTVC